MLHELERHRQWCARKTNVNYFQTMRPPEAQSLPLNSRNVGMFRRQLSD